MSMILEEVETDTTDNDYDGLDHIYCIRCYPESDVSYCGSDISFATDVYSEAELTNPCMVCLDLEYCPLCGWF